MGATFLERLEERIAAGAAPACVGIDPRPDRLPATVAPDAAPADRVVAFAREVLPRIARHAPVVKPNVAFFEALGWEGYRAYEAVCRAATDAGLLVIGDVKRGDIGATAAAYARGHFALADALTVSPFLGDDAVEPFLDACRTAGKGVFVLVRTSNPGGDRFQGLELARGGTVSGAVAQAVDRWGRDTSSPSGFSHVGAVVGATRPEELAVWRERMPRAVFLIPGVGAQGGRIDQLGPAFDGRGLGAIVNQSRGVLQSFEPADPDWLDRVDAAAAAFANELRALEVRR